MDFEYFLSVLFIRYRDFHYLIKAAWPQHSRIKYVQPVRDSQHQNPFQLLNAIHFSQKLAQNPLCYMGIR